MDKKIEYGELKIEYALKYSKEIKDIAVYLLDLKVANGVFEFLELVAVFEAFLANQLPRSVGKYKVVIKDKTPYLWISTSGKALYLNKAKVKIFLKFLKNLEKSVNLIYHGEDTKEIEDEF